MYRNENGRGRRARWARRTAAGLVLGGALLATTTPALAYDLVTIGNPGNAPELSGTSAGGAGFDKMVGGVDYVYEMGKFEVTAAQYVAFLNAVAATDTHGLYDPAMFLDSYGCKIERLGSPGGYTYQVASDWAQRPVNFISWGDAARFANWMTNGQPSGPQNLSTTESGSYPLNGATTAAELAGISRSPAAVYAIPSEDEWYKSAYFDARSATDRYWRYATGTEIMPSNYRYEPDRGNTANYYHLGYTLGSPYWRTEVGDFENSPSPYGTFDQNGNVWEWTEELMFDTRYLLRGGSSWYGYAAMQANWRSSTGSPDEGNNTIGLRLVRVPEPTTLCLAAVSGLAMLRLRR